MKERKSFLLLTRHTDSEITDFLQRKAEKGWMLTSVKGNIFRFRREPYSGKRVCAYSFLSRTPETQTEIQLREELPYLRKNGWDMIAISGAENIADTRRHAFLYEEKKADDYPKTEPDVDKKSAKRGRRKIFSNLVLSLLYLAFISILFSFDIIRITSSPLYLIASCIFSVLLLLCIFLSIRALITLLERRKNQDGYIKKGLYRYLDYSTLLIFATLLLFVIFLSFDYLYGDLSRGGEKTKIGNTTVVLYNDDIPITLSELGFDANGEYETRKKEESKSILSSYLYSYEQHLGEGASADSFLSYTIYESRFKSLRTLARNELINSNLYSLSDKAHSLSVDSYKQSENGREILIEDEDTILYIRAGKALDIRAIDKILELIK